MKDNQKNIDELFRAELGNYAEIPPPAVWNALDKKLGGLPPKAPGFFNRWPGYLSIISAIVVIGFLITKVITTSQLDSAAKNSVSTAADTKATGNHTDISTGIKTNSIVTADKPAQQAAITNETALNENGKVAASPAGTSPADQANATYNNTIHNPADDDNNTATAKNTHSPAGSKEASEERSVQPNNKKLHPKAQLAKAASPARKGVRKQHAGYAMRNKPGTKAVNNNRSQNQTSKTSSIAINNYGSAPEDNNNEAPAGGPLLPAAEPPIPGTFKEAAKADSTLKKQDNVTPLTKKPLPKINPIAKVSRFEAGIKAGYEGGTANTAGNKIVISPYIQYKLSDKLSLMVQPAVKYAHVAATTLKGTQSFYKENNDSSATLNKIPIVEEVGSVENITYSQSRDTVVKSYTTGNKYTEYELPILLKYSLSSKCSVYGGFTLSYSSYISITEHTYTGAPMYDTLTSKNTVVFNGGSDITPAPVSSEIKFSGNNISSYKGPLYTASPGGLFRMGYMLGFNYKYGSRWLLDALIQQSAAKSAVQGAYNTNAPFSVPYFRFTVGYRVF